MTSPYLSGTATTFPNVTGNPNLDPLIVWGYRWGNTGIGTPAAVTYSFPSAGAAWIGDYLDGEPFSGFTAFSAAQQNAARAAMSLWAEVANITFTEVADSPTDVGDIRFANSAVVTNSTAAAWGYFPYTDPDFQFPEAGDVWFDAKYPPNLQLAPGQYGFSTMIHEIGHAIGLDHPFEDQPGEPTLPSYLDTDKYTIMSYTADPSTLAYASTPQLLDIAAIQYIYGANMTTRTGNDNYKFSATTQVNKTIWDAGGIDTLDFSNQTSTTEISLVEGTYSRFAMQGGGVTSSLLGIAYGVTIENAIGGSSHNVIQGNQVANRLVGGNNDDRLYGAGGDDKLEGLGGHDYLWGGDGIDTLLGYAGNDQLYAAEDGSINDDYLDGGAGIDYMVGGDGDDTYVVDSSSDMVVEALTDLNDKILTSISLNLSTFADGRVEHATLLGSAAINVTGNSANNRLVGNDGANTLNGGGGADVMTGGKGNDTYVVNHAGDEVVETLLGATGGVDTVNSSISFSLAGLANVENLTLLVTASTNATGNNLNNVLTGNDGANRLDGWAGNDKMIGGKGDDHYVVDSVGDIVSETILNSAGGGVDTIESSITFSLAPLSNVEKLTLGGASAINGTGNGLSNEILGNAAANLLDGGSGADMLKGGAGNDIYILDNSGDAIDEEGNDDDNDQVRTTISVNLSILGAGLIEHATLLGAAAISATGNDLDNQLTGNDGANTLNGGGGADIMTGGKGNDTYVVNHGGDQVIETIAGSAGGVDLVRSAITFSLASLGNVENVTLLGVNNSNAGGNSLNNILIGNDGDNRLNGYAGNDTMAGGKGDDTYVVNATGDVLQETVLNSAGGGVDTVESTITFSLTSHTNIENLSLVSTGAINGTGNGLDNVLTGNGAANTLDGGIGNDTLVGGGGVDKLMGGADEDILRGGDGSDFSMGGTGRDTFDFDRLSEAGDTIADFVIGAAGDILDIHDLLGDIGYAGSDPFADAVLSFTKVGANTLVSIDADGVAAGAATTLVTLLNITITQTDIDNYIV